MPGELTVGPISGVPDRALMEPSDIALEQTVHQHPTFVWAEAALVQVVIAIIGLDLRIRPGLSITLPLAVLLAPLWLPYLRRFRHAPLIVVLTGASIISGIVLSELARVDHSVSQANRVQAIALLLSGLSAMALILWARAHVSLHRIVGLYGLGALAGALTTGQTSWKFDLTVPLIFLALGMLGARRPRYPVVALVALGALGGFNEGRSLFALALLAALLAMWQRLPAIRPAHPWLPIAMLAVLAVAVYFLATAVMTSGYLGDTLRERTTEQIDTTGSLIAGGRPEWSATMALMGKRPQGFGLGVVPSWGDYMTGKSGLASINVDTGGYAQHYLFGGQFRLHAVVADLWVSYGLVGLAFGAAVVLLLVRNLGILLSSRQAHPAILFASVLALWYLFFGPIYSDWLHVCVALGFVLAPRVADSR